MTSPIPPPATVRGLTVWQPRLFTLTARLPCIQIQAGGGGAASHSSRSFLQVSFRLSLSSCIMSKNSACIVQIEELAGGVSGAVLDD